MINKQGLHKIIDIVESGSPLLPGEVRILRDAVDLLDDLARTCDKIIQDVDHPGYLTDSPVKIIERDCGS